MTQTYLRINYDPNLLFLMTCLKFSSLIKGFRNMKTKFKVTSNIKEIKVLQNGQFLFLLNCAFLI